MTKYWVSALLFILTSITCFAQVDFPIYRQFARLTTMADSLYGKGQYTASAKLYENAASLKVEKAIKIPMVEVCFNTASIWATAKNYPKAMFWLRKATNEFAFANYTKVDTAEEFRPMAKRPDYKAFLVQLKAKEDRQNKFAARLERQTIWKTKPDVPFFGPLTKYAKSVVANDTMPLTGFNHGGYRVFLRADSYAAAHIPAIKTSIDDADERAKRILGVPSLNKGISIVLVDTPEELAQYTGLKLKGGIAELQDDMVFVVYNAGRRPQFRHELFHQISYHVWGQSYCRLLLEGSAVLADDNCWVPDPVTSINAYIYSQGRQYPIKDLINRFDQIALKDEPGAYLQSAGVFRYLQERHGNEKMKQLWTAGFDQFRSIYGYEIEELERLVKANYATKPVPPGLDWKQISTQGCG